MKNYLALLLILLLSPMAVHAQIEAVTKNGDKVILKNDGTWSYADSAKKSIPLTESIQCKGITKAGNQCKRMVSSGSEYCFQHESQKNQAAPMNPSVPAAPSASNRQSQSSSVSTQCSGTTKKGTRCKHMTRSSNGLCYQHGGN